MRARFFLPVLLPVTLLAALLLPLAARAGNHLPKVKPAQSYPGAMVQDQVAIAAVPYVTADQQKLFAIPYRKFSFVPVRLIITNNSDRPISIADVRVYFISASNDRISAATPDDVERAIPLRDKQGRKIPVGPFHVPTHSKDSDWRVQQDFNRYEYNALSVPAHSTIAGFIWYDVDGLGSNPLQNASLVVREVKNADGQELFYFQIPFNKYLGAR